MAIWFQAMALAGALQSSLISTLVKLTESASTVFVAPLQVVRVPNSLLACITVGIAYLTPKTRIKISNSEVITKHTIISVIIPEVVVAGVNAIQGQVIHVIADYWHLRANSTFNKGRVHPQKVGCGLVILDLGRRGCDGEWQDPVMRKVQSGS